MALWLWVKPCFGWGLEPISIRFDGALQDICAAACAKYLEPSLNDKRPGAIFQGVAFCADTPVRLALRRKQATDVIRVPIGLIFLPEASVAVSDICQASAGRQNRLATAMVNSAAQGQMKRGVA